VHLCPNCEYCNVQEHRVALASFHLYCNHQRTPARGGHITSLRAARPVADVTFGRPGPGGDRFCCRPSRDQPAAPAVPSTWNGMALDGPPLRYRRFSSSSRRSRWRSAARCVIPHPGDCPVTAARRARLGSDRRADGQRSCGWAGSAGGRVRYNAPSPLGWEAERDFRSIGRV
jgi:hypothetical protein